MKKEYRSLEEVGEFEAQENRPGKTLTKLGFLSCVFLFCFA